MTEQPYNSSKVREPKWTGDQHDMAVLVSTGEPRRTEEQLRNAVYEQVLTYLTKYPPLMPVAATFDNDVLAETAHGICVEYVGPNVTSVMLSREKLLTYLGMAIQRLRMRGKNL